MSGAHSLWKLESLDHRTDMKPGENMEIRVRSQTSADNGWVHLHPLSRLEQDGTKVVGMTSDFIEKLQYRGKSSLWIQNDDVIR